MTQRDAQPTAIRPSRRIPPGNRPGGRPRRADRSRKPADIRRPAIASSSPAAPRANPLPERLPNALRQTSRRTGSERPVSQP